MGSPPTPQPLTPLDINRGGPVGGPGGLIKGVTENEGKVGNVGIVRKVGKLGKVGKVGKSGKKGKIGKVRKLGK